MNIFVASWFFPPNSSSEGFVTYKLLRNSAFNYDVVCATSKKWGYQSSMDIDAPNISIIPVKTEEIDIWVKEAITIFEERHQKKPYDVIMTRSMPPEAVEVGLKIKEKYPNIKWIASFGDPIANNPYVNIGIHEFLPIADEEKQRFISDMGLTCEKWSQDWLTYPDATIRHEAYMRSLQDTALDEADLIVCPNNAQKQYMLRGRSQKKPFLVVPHSFDEHLYLNIQERFGLDPAKINLVYLGYSDSRRSLMPLLKSLRMLYQDNPVLASKLCFHIFGNNPTNLIDYVQTFLLPKELVSFHGNVSYYESLHIMTLADWLVHVDAYFVELRETGGSVFLAGKIADYIGAQKPILALTGKSSPADDLVVNYGGVSLLAWDDDGILKSLREIAKKKDITVDTEYSERLRASNVAKEFDVAVNNLLKKKTKITTVRVYGEVNTTTEKVLTVCVPCYNAEKTLSRCLNSILSVSQKELLDIIVVDDESSDDTAQIALTYVNDYPGIVRLIRKPNGGHGSGINIGIKYACASYYRVVDSDDWVSSSEMEKFIEILKSKKFGNVDAYYTNYHIVNAVTGMSSEWPKPERIQYNKKYLFEQLSKTNMYLTMAGTTFSTKVLRESGVQCHEHCYYADSEFILKPIPYISTVVFLDLYIYKYLQGQENQSVSHLSFVRNYENHKTILQELIGYYKSTKMPKAQSAYFYNLLKAHLATHYQILTEWDDDETRAFRRKVEFDAYLQKACPPLYHWNVLRLSVPDKVRTQIKTILPTSPKKYIRKIIKGVLPYGLIRLWQKHRYGV